MKTSPTFSQAVTGYELYADARRLSEHTIADYKNTFKRFLAFLNSDPPLDQITPTQVEQFLAFAPVSAKTALNYHTGLSALYTWAVKQRLVAVHILHEVDRPDPEQRAIQPYTLADVRAMISALKHSRVDKANGPYPHSNYERDHAIILLLLDTGLRASELCDLLIHQADLKNRRLRAFGKGSKERILPFSAATGQALWKYLTSRKDLTNGDRVFVTQAGDPLTRARLNKLFHFLGLRAGVTGANCHRWRHTFAINYLRNGGDSFSLQMMLGHTTMEMVKKYLSLAQADLETTHKRASPVSNWNLK